MASNAELNFMAFIAALHVVMFFAASNGIITQQSGNSPSETFINDIRDDQLTGEVLEEQEGETSGFIQDNFAIFFVVKDFVFSLLGIITAPYAIPNSGALPPFLAMMFNVMMSIGQIWFVYRMVTMIT